MFPRLTPTSGCVCLLFFVFLYSFISRDWKIALSIQTSKSDKFSKHEKGTHGSSFAVITSDDTHSSPIPSSCCSCLRSADAAALSSYACFDISGERVLELHCIQQVMMTRRKRAGERVGDRREKGVGLSVRLVDRILLLFVQRISP